MPNYNSTLQTNNSSLEEIITQLNNMPDAGSSGGGSVETCTVNLSTSDGYISEYIYDHIVDGKINSTRVVTTDSSTVSVTLNDVVCGTFLFVRWTSNSISVQQQYGLENIGNGFSYLHVTANAGETAILKCYNLA